MEQERLKINLNKMQLNSMDSFFNISGRFSGQEKDSYFLRYIGFNEETEYTEKLPAFEARFMAGTKMRKTGYGRVSSLPFRPSPDELTLYQQILGNLEINPATMETLGGRFSFDNSLLDQNLCSAFLSVLATFRQVSPHCSDSITKNFTIKLLYWIDSFFPQLFPAGFTPAASSKLVFIGPIKLQEYLFLYLLTLCGCDVLYLRPDQDALDLPQQALALSQVYVASKTGALEPAPFAASSAPLPKAPAQPAKPAMGSSPSQAPAQPAKPAMGSSPSQAPAQPAKPATGSSPSQAPAQPAKPAMGSSPSQAPAQPAKPATGSDDNFAAGPYIPQFVETPGFKSPEPLPPISIPGPGAVAPPVIEESPRRQTSAPINIATQRSATAARPPKGPQPQKNGSLGNSAVDLAYEQLAQKAASVVMIEAADRNGHIFKSGSGVMIAKNGYILTNYHVIEEGSVFQIRLETEEHAYQTNQIVKYHPQLDLAILQIDRACEPIPLCAGEEITRGQKVVAIGSPLGLFNTVSDGIISAFRTVNDVPMIQFTAPISSGSSGGALLNMKGELIGLCTAGFDQGQNLNLAVEYQTIRAFVGGILSC